MRRYAWYVGGALAALAAVLLLRTAIIRLFGGAEGTAAPVGVLHPAPVPTGEIVMLDLAGGKAGTGDKRYTVKEGDTLGQIATLFDLPVQTLVDFNHLTNADALALGQVLSIPVDPNSPTPEAPLGDMEPTPDVRQGVVERQTQLARNAAPGSLFYRTTWVSYYGRPDAPILGILGEYDIDALVPILKEQAAAYDQANGPILGVKPAFHLIYGMASVWEGDDGSFLMYMPDEQVMSYIDRARQEGFGVFLDVQIGALDPVSAIQPALKFLKYDNVHLALDPEFAMVHEGQTVPGNPIGRIWASQINNVQASVRSYMAQNGIKGSRILIVHQFLPEMIQDKEMIAAYDEVDVVICADGFGSPGAKMSKYNWFMTPTVQYAGFKLFYQWDVPVLDEVHVLGVEAHPDSGYMDVTPNVIIYQ